MNVSTSSRLACTHTALFELGQAVRSCELVTLALEEIISEWVESAALEILPIEQLQQLDYLRQMQSDLATALLYMSRNKSGMAQAELHGFEITSLLEILHLGEVKERLLRATSPYQDRSADEPASVRHSSDVVFFGDD